MINDLLYETFLYGYAQIRMIKMIWKFVPKRIRTWLWHQRMGELIRQVDSGRIHEKVLIPYAMVWANHYALDFPF